MKINFAFKTIFVAFVFFAANRSLANPILPIYKGTNLPDICVLEENRDERFLEFLRVSVKISVPGGVGSGTICHYDKNSGWAHVISCGHLWSGNKEYDPKIATRAKITVWYQNSGRVENPKTYDAEALFWSNARGYDVSLLRFRPDWIPSYAPISSYFMPKRGKTLHSMGCDGGGEVARYEVRVASFKHPDITTEKNSPRPGRSGGGLINDNKTLVGVCWGSSDIVNGDGIGYFTPLDSIREVFTRNKHEWLLNLDVDARRIPVVDHGSSEEAHGFHFIPVPQM